jgi:hypothetical protein
MSRLPTMRSTLFVCFPLPNALLIPDRSHSKLAVRAGYAPEVPPGEVREHRIPLEAQPPAQGRGVQDLVILGHLYAIEISLLHHDQHHTEIIDEYGKMSVIY